MGGTALNGVPLVGVLVLHPQRRIAGVGEFGPQGQRPGHHADLDRHHPARPGRDVRGPTVHNAHAHVPSMSVSAAFSATVTVSFQKYLTVTQSSAYWHQKSRFGGFHYDG